MIDKSNIDKYLDFGAMQVHEVRYFCKETFDVKVFTRTFNIEYAKIIKESIIKNQNKDATIYSYYVKFHNES